MAEGAGGVPGGAEGVGVSAAAPVAGVGGGPVAVVAGADAARLGAEGQSAGGRSGGRRVGSRCPIGLPPRMWARGAFLSRLEGRVVGPGAGAGRCERVGWTSVGRCRRGGLGARDDGGLWQGVGARPHSERARAGPPVHARLPERRAASGGRGRDAGRRVVVARGGVASGRRAGGLGCGRGARGAGPRAGAERAGERGAGPGGAGGRGRVAATRVSRRRAVWTRAGWSVTGAPGDRS